MNAHIEKAIEISGGTQSSLATACGVSQVAVLKWLKDRSVISAENALSVEQATNGEVTVHDLRPDIFGPPTTHAA